VDTMALQLAPLCKALSRLGRREGPQIVYEAGPCGYTLARQLRGQGFSSQVIAPSRPAVPGTGSRPTGAMRCCLRAQRAPELVNRHDPG
jgi:hypothetical protein